MSKKTVLLIALQSLVAVVIVIGMIGALRTPVIAAPPKDEKRLNLYGCTDLREYLAGADNFSDYFKVCKIYEPETGRRYLIAIVDDGKGGGVSIVPIDKP